MSNSNESRPLVKTGGRTEHGPGIRVPWLLVAVVALAAAFLVAPWTLAHKAHAVLHGLCAQRPSHTLWLGDQLLPFDARMTGIYGGFAVATVYLLARGRFRAVRLPMRPALVVLGLFVAAMGIDGFNALLDDLGSPIYLPDNRLRLATGLLAGVALAVVLCFLVATTLWRSGDWAAAPVGGVGEAMGLAALGAPFAALVLSGWGWLYAPISLLLVGSAVTAVAMLTTATILLATGRDRQFRGIADAQPMAAVGLLVAVAFVLLVAAGRFWLEREFGLRTLT
jgi:uncharacterized membrane protein